MYIYLFEFKGFFYIYVQRLIFALVWVWSTVCHTVWYRVRRRFNSRFNRSFNRSFNGLVCRPSEGGGVAVAVAVGERRGSSGRGIPQPPCGVRICRESHLTPAAWGAAPISSRQQPGN